jgi:hypothetical protein
MRSLLCERCGAGKVAGTRTNLGEYSGRFMGPPECERVVWGIALTPTPEQRVIHRNGKPMLLPMGEYTCDLCGGPILPGARCCALSAWPADWPAMPMWEANFLEAEQL